MSDDHIFNLNDLEELIQAARDAQALLPTLEEDAQAAKLLIKKLEALQARSDWSPEPAAVLIAAANAIVEQIHKQADALLDAQQEPSRTLH